MYFPQAIFKSTTLDSAPVDASVKYTLLPSSVIVATAAWWHIFSDVSCAVCVRPRRRYAASVKPWRNKTTQLLSADRKVSRVLVLVAAFSQILVWRITRKTSRYVRENDDSPC